MLYPRLATIALICPYVTEDKVIIQILNGWPEGRKISQHTPREQRAIGIGPRSFECYVFQDTVTFLPYQFIVYCDGVWVGDDF